MIKDIVHYGFHFVFPFVLGWLFFPQQWKKASLIMLGTMLVDLDHLFATPIFDADRNSIGYHFLHSYPAIAVYIIGSIFAKGTWKMVFIGLLWHMITDFQDYYFWR
ncbi:DUF6122 family protein [Bergeyella zoohelcum]|uniref:Phospholipase C/D domain-containing protein n=2 Tax=Bergeyella zoohelcum TaxID=1015 RepID=K1M3L9_9FLAO|nr:DUF6122 family protein [Bergeyella zoohelcum]EKB56983.1 hypothetical protein HMPREF9699_01147 [Bergeyella zoohelcum ATCC 43767]MDY6025726.1 DUF6122 family protein [Bergeyella zoohelcum]SUV48671.1 Uncharacterised protein [Bergeyella zoohelcum]VDH02697.1 Uncharacterised protein [Bergeyella zoohelcum]